MNDISQLDLFSADNKVEQVNHTSSSSEKSIEELDIFSTSDIERELPIEPEIIVKKSPTKPINETNLIDTSNISSMKIKKKSDKPIISKSKINNEIIGKQQANDIINSIAKESVQNATKPLNNVVAFPGVSQVEPKVTPKVIKIVKSEIPTIDIEDKEVIKEKTLPSESIKQEATEQVIDEKPRTILMDNFDDVGELPKSDVTIKEELVGAKEDIIKLLKVAEYNREFNKLRNQFMKGIRVLAGDFEAYCYNKVIMITSYKGSSTRIEFPSHIANAPVCYIDSMIFQDTPYIKKSISKYINMSRESRLTMSEVSVEDITLDKTGLEVVFPNTLLTIPNCILKDVKEVKSIIIPANVKEIAPHAFKYSGLERIVFNGKITRGFDKIKFPSNCEVFVKDKHKSEFM